MGDFSIANNLNANEAEFQLGRNQSKLRDDARRLSSGLRIESAADDPSGLAISEHLMTRVEALTQSSQNVTTASNALAVADGAMSTITNILLRIRNLAVEAASSISSDGDRANLQQEVDSLVAEVNRISQNANFNGQKLLDGSHQGFQPAQAAQLTVTANTALASTSSSSQTNLLVQKASFISGAQQPTIWFALKSPVTASPSPQTVSISDASYVQPGTTYVLNGGLVKVQSVNPAAGTMTAIFSASGAVGNMVSALVGGSLTGAVAAGTQVATISGSAQPLYAGEVLQVDPINFALNDVVVVQKVLSPTSFVATFTKAHAAGAQVYSENGTTIGANFGPGNFTYSFGGTPTDGPAIGSTAYVIESSSYGFPPASGSTTRVVATGTVTAASINSQTIHFAQKIPDYFGGWFMVVNGLGLGAVPLTTTNDGTIKLQVVNTGVSIAVQETFYDTASHASVTSPYLLAPGEQTMLFDGVVTTLGTFTTADVGTSAYIKVQQATAAVTSPNTPALSIHSGASEGQNVKISIPSVSAASLRISTLSVEAPPDGGDPTLAAQDTIGQVDFALTRVLTIRAGLGAQIVGLAQESNADDLGAVNLQASESSIRDANMPADSAAFTLDQIDVEVGLSVLSQVNNLPEQVLKLFR
ncbi:MAG TPA: flagellin [Candidatus Aquilonibacter sp.]|nr:flagellin [Candidatus Aquilonibacter sp.]